MPRRWKASGKAESLTGKKAGPLSGASRRAGERKDQMMLKWKTVLAVLLVLALFPAGVCGEGAPCLDASLSMLENGNPFLNAYNRLTGRNIQARFELGCPYFFGGSDYGLIGKTRKAWQDSTYYKDGVWYPAGFDCAGFTKWVLQESGWQPHPALSTLLDSSAAIPGTEGAAAQDLPGLLQAGDLLVIRHGNYGYHVLMYIGTLLDFGFHPEWLPDGLKDKAGHPLVIHCSSNLDYSERYEAWCRKNANWATTTDGGVMVSILNCSPDGCDGVLKNLDRTASPYFLLEGYHLTVYTTQPTDRTKWVRCR